MNTDIAQHHDVEPFMRAICLNPADDVRRLAYSDWLEEHDELPRAEFIRVECRIAELKRDCGCGSCVKMRGGGQHHNSSCAVDRERDTQPDGTTRQAMLWFKLQSLIDKICAEATQEAAQ